MTGSIAFQTGRQYSEKGQRIAATILDDGRVAFVDLDRYIEGITENIFDLDTHWLQDWLMKEYDNCRYNSGLYSSTYETLTEVKEQLHALANTL